MKKQINIILGLALMAQSCNTKVDQQGGDSKDTAREVHQPVPAEQVQQKVMIKDQNLNAIYLQYLALSEALTEGRSADARINSNAIEAGAREIRAGATLASAAARITNAADLETQRRYFSTLSNEMIRLINNSGVESGTVYVDFCPMALNDKGAYWLSSEKEIRNPYFGDAMLNCGEVKKTISQ